MESNVQQSLELLERCENIALSFLDKFFSPNEIESFVNDYRNNPSKSSSELTDYHHSAIVGLFMVRTLIDQVKVHLDTNDVTTEYAAKLVRHSLTAGLYIGMPLGEFGMLLVESLADNAIKGVKFSGKNQRQDALGKTLEKIVKEYIGKHGKFPQYRDVVHCLGRLADSQDRTIQEVDKELEIIYWQRPSGKPEETNFKLLRDRLTGIRKKYVGNIPT